MKKIVFAYSGSLNASAAIAWLIEQHRAEVVTVTVDVGQGHGLDDVRERALAIGATRAHVIDARDEFARDFVLRSLHAGAVDDGQRPLPAALTRPVIARHMVAIARLEGAPVVAHGCEDAGDAARLEAAIESLDPALTVLAPVQQWDMTRDELVAFARHRGIPVFAAGRAESVQASLWGRAIGIHPSDDEPSEDAYVLTESPASAPDEPAYVEVAFEAGVPLAVNGVAMPLTELIASLETIAGAHGVGRVDGMTHDSHGAPAREILEAPAAVVLHAAHTALQRTVTPRELHRLASDLGPKYVELIERGLWFTPTREASDALVAKVQERVTGTVRAKLFKGQCQIVGTESPHARPRAPRPARRVAAAGKR